MHLPQHLPASKRSTGIVAASLLVHLLLLALVTYRTRVWVAPVRLPGTATGSRMVLTYMPGRAVSAASLARMVKPVTSIQHRLIAPAATRPKPMPAETSPAPASPPQPAGSGLDALGEGDVSIALMQFFPDPRPDLSRLPHGSRGDVVLEAVIDAAGRIAQLTVKQSVGYGVDESVIATVQQWTFHPAMRDGKPVASQQEFHFHYERG